MKPLKTWLFRGEQLNAVEIGERLGLASTTVYYRAQRGLLDKPVDRKTQAAVRRQYEEALAESGVHEIGESVDLDVPWEQDAACQRLVRNNPEGMTLEAIGIACGLTRERVRQIEAGVAIRMSQQLKRDNQRGRDARLLLELLRDKVSLQQETHWERAEKHAPGNILLGGWVKKHGRKHHDPVGATGRNKAFAARERQFARGRLIGAAKAKGKTSPRKAEASE